jgi:hypothetical protein
LGLAGGGFAGEEEGALEHEGDFEGVEEAGGGEVIGGGDSWEEIFRYIS